MDRAGEISLLKTLLHYLDTKTTCMATAPWRNEVTAFTCPERHEREQEILIRKRPLVMGLSCDWPKPGAYRTEDYAGVPILTVRGSDGKLRAFLNVCRHRGAKVAQGCGNAGAFTCPYHGWTYGNDGLLPSTKAITSASCTRNRSAASWSTMSGTSPRSGATSVSCSGAPSSTGCAARRRVSGT